MNNQASYQDNLEDFINNNEKLIKKASLTRKILIVIWAIVTLLGISVFFISWFEGIFASAFAFMITGVIVQTISGNQVDKIFKNCLGYFSEIIQYNKSEMPENFLNANLFTRACKKLWANNQYIVKSNSKFVDIHDLIVYNHYRSNGKSRSYKVWEGQVIGRENNLKNLYKLYISNSDTFNSLRLTVSDSSIVPFCHNYRVSISNPKVLENWEMPKLTELVQSLSSNFNKFTLMITNKDIVLAIDEEYDGSYSWMWDSNVREMLKKRYESLTKMVEIANLIANFEVIEKN